MIGDRVEPEDRCKPPRAARAAGEDAEACRIPDNLVEEQGRMGAPPDVHFADRTNLEVPIGAGDVRQFAESADLVEPSTKVERIARAHAGWAAHGSSLLLARVLAATWTASTISR